MSSVEPILVDAEPIIVTVENETIQITVTGARGPQGPPGIASDDPSITTQIHTQELPSDFWEIELEGDWIGTYPSVIVIDTSGGQCYGTVNYPTPAKVEISFGSAFSGTAALHR